MVPLTLSFEQERNNGDLSDFSTQKNDLSSTVLIRFRFHWYRCKSDIAVFKWGFI